MALAVGLAVLLAPSFSKADGWKAGAAKVVITPQTSVWMAGYGFRDHPSEGTLQDLWVKALAVEDASGSRAVLITADVCGISGEISSAIRDEIQKAHHIDRSRVVIACSHTHSGPVVGTYLISMYPLDDEQRQKVIDYSEIFKKLTIEVAAKAFEDLKPAKISWDTGRCDFAVNRRANNQANVPNLRAAIALNGPEDHDVPVLRVSDSDGKLQAIVCGYACHNTTLHGYKFSGDYAGHAQIDLEKAHPGAIALFWSGCGADQNPLPRGTVEQAEDYGARLSQAVEEVLARPMKPVKGELQTAYDEIDLALAPVPDRAHWEELAKSENPYEVGRAKLLLKKLDDKGSLDSTYPYPVQAWHFGDDLTWIFLGGEVVVDYSHRIKRNLGSRNTWVAGYCNDVMAYIPSLRVLKEGGYEGGGAMVYYGLPAPWSEKVEEQVIAAVRDVVQSLHSKN
jgi:hypothetical protein